MQIDEIGKPVVAHSLDTYLFLTGSWVYSQIRNVREIRPIVICDRQANTDTFPFAPICSLGDCSRMGARLARCYRKVFALPSSLFESYLRREEARILHSHFGTRGYDDLALARALKVPHITAFYGFDAGLPKQSRRWRRRYQRLFDEGTLFLAEGSHMKERLVALGCREEKIIVQHLGVDVERIPFQTRQIGPNEEIRILVAASFREKKGIPYALEALARCLQKHRTVRLTLIGDSHDTRGSEAEKAKIMCTMREHALARYVHWMGYQPYPIFLEELYRHHILLAPSVTAGDGDIEGGAPVSLIEASASGMPVLSTIHCDIPEVIQDGKSGLLVPERDVVALADALDSLIESPEQRETMGRWGRGHVEREYNGAHQRASWRLSMDGSCEPCSRPRRRRLRSRFIAISSRISGHLCPRCRRV